MRDGLIEWPAPISGTMIIECKAAECIRTVSYSGLRSLQAFRIKGSKSRTTVPSTVLSWPAFLPEMSEAPFD